MGPPRIFNPWGERSSPEYLLLKRSFGTYTRGVPAKKSTRGTKSNPLALLSHHCDNPQSQTARDYKERAGTYSLTYFPPSGEELCSPQLLWVK